MKSMNQVIISVAIVMLISSCSNTGRDNNSGKLKAIEESQKVIISRLDGMKDIKQKITRLEKQQNNLQTAIANLEKSIANISTKDQRPTPTKEKNKTTQNTNSQWRSNTVYTAPVGDSYYIGPADAKVTITEWGDYF